MFVCFLEHETALFTSAAAENSRISYHSEDNTYDEIGPGLLVSAGEEHAQTLLPEEHDEQETICDDEIIEYLEVDDSMDYVNNSATTSETITSNQAPEEPNYSNENLNSSAEEDKHENENYAVLGERYDRVYQPLKYN